MHPTPDRHSVRAAEWELNQIRTTEPGERSKPAPGSHSLEQEIRMARNSDERIREDVSDRLMTHPDVDASEIEVHVSNGVVTLDGIIENRHQKRIAEFLAEDVLGVN